MSDAVHPPPTFLTARGIEISPGQDLGGSSRSRVSRHQVVRAPQEWGTSVVIKAFDGDAPAEGFLRERVGLAHLAGAPRLLAQEEETSTLVMEDLGTADTLADILLGGDPELAWNSCLRWARALGEHVVAEPAVLAEVADTLGAAETESRRIAATLPGAGLDAMTEWGLRYAEAAHVEIDEASTALWAQGDRLVISAGDTCPDNALFTSTGVRFLDMEGTGTHPVALDAAYAMEPFSSCWCVFTPPSGLTEAMLAEFTAGAARQLPALATDPHWPAQVRSAVVMWVVSSAGWLLPSARKGVASIGPADRLAPSHRQLLVKRWRWVIAHAADDFPDTASACDEALTAALREWGTRADDGTGATRLDLPGYPAWA